MGYLLGVECYKVKSGEAPFVMSMGNWRKLVPGKRRRKQVFRESNFQTPWGLREKLEGTAGS